MFTINFKGKPNPKDENLVKLEMVFFRTDYNRTSKMIATTGLYEDWDQKNQCFKTNIKKEPERNKDNQTKNNALLSLKSKCLNAVEELNSISEEWSPIEWSHYFEDDNIVHKNEKVKVVTISQYIDILTERKKKEKRLKNGVFISCLRTAEIYESLKRELERFTIKEYNRKFSTFFFREIGEDFLKKFVFHLQERGVDNGNNAALPQKLKSLYGTFYYANKDKQPHTDLSIFECIHQNYKVEEQKPQTIPYEWICRIEDMDKSQFTINEQFYIDLFLFSFYCGGIAPIDMSYLTWDSFTETMIVYERIKFPKKAEMPFNDNIKSILRKYRHQCYNNYVLPIFTHKQREQWQQTDRLERLREAVAKTLKIVAQVLKLEKEFTWYAARGTFITKMLDEGYHPMAVAKMSGNSPATIYKHYYDQTKTEDVRIHMNHIFSRNKVS